MTFQQFAFNNVSRNRRTYAAYFLSSAFSVTVFFVFAMFIFHPDVAGEDFGNATVAINVAEYIIFLFSIFFVLYSVSAFLKRRKKEFGILMMHGMSRGQLNRLVFLENMIIGLASISTGVVLGMIFSKLFLIVVANLLEMKALPFYVPWKALLLTLLAFTALFLLISMFTAFMVRVNKLIELLEGSARPKSEPKHSLLLSILAALLLGTGYLLSFTAKDMMVVFLMVPVTIMVIIGTYFFFTQLSVCTIGALKRNRLFYWKKTNIVILSDLAYRLKDNARMFFLVTIVSTVAFCATGTLAGFIEAVEEQFEDTYIFALSYESNQGNQREAQHLSMIENELKNEKISYEKLEATIVFQASAESGEEVALVKLSDYNRFADALGYQTVSLENREGRFLPSYAQETSQKRMITLQESNISIRAEGTVTNRIFPSGVVPDNILLVPDQVFESIENPKQEKRYIGYQVANWQETKQAGERLTKAIGISEEGKYDFDSLAAMVASAKKAYRILLFVGLFISIIFFVAAGSFLYFRLYTDLDEDKRQYRAITKLGLTEKELNKIGTTQLALLFFVPIALAIVHSSVAFVALQNFLGQSIVKSASVVLFCFLLLQVAYFLLIRSRYLRHLKEAVM